MKKRTILLGLALAGCLPSSPPPPAHPAGPPPAPKLATPPWERGSVAEGFEMPVPDGPPVIIRGATLLLATGKKIARGTIVLEKGKITSVHDGDIAPPSGAVVIDGAGKFVTPGIIDTHSHLGVYPMPDAGAHLDGNEMVGPVQPQAQAADAFWPQDPGIMRAVAGGVTAIQVLPGSGNLIGGRAVTVKLRPGLSSRAMHFHGAPDGLKMACGENPKRVYGTHKQAPMTRMGNLALQRSAFLSAKKLKRDWEKYAEDETRRAAKEAKSRAEHEAKKQEREKQQETCRKDPTVEQCEGWAREWREKKIEEPEPTAPIEKPARDPGLETLIAAMEGRVLVHVHCYRADDMLDMLALSDEVGFKVRSFHHALEAYKIRGELAARGGIGVSTWADWWGFKLEAYDGIPENAALAHEAGARAIIHSDSAEGIQRLNQEASKALSSGQAAGVKITEEDAIRWVTANPAWALGVDARTGTLEAGKDADVVLWDKSPFSVYASAEKVWVDGVMVYDRVARPRPWSDFEVGQDVMDSPELLPGAGGVK
jgi:imidazolonepropionase-like amidohydrolase